jgi:hypothetical protein
MLWANKGLACIKSSCHAELAGMSFGFINLLQKHVHKDTCVQNDLHALHIHTFQYFTNASSLKCTLTFIHMHACMHVCMHVCMCMYTCVPPAALYIDAGMSQLVICTDKASRTRDMHRQGLTNTWYAQTRPHELVICTDKASRTRDMHRQGLTNTWYAQTRPHEHVICTDKASRTRDMHRQDLTNSKLITSFTLHISHVTPYLALHQRHLRQ